MRHTIALLFALTIAAMATAAPETAAPQWERTVAGAKARASRAGRPILVYLFDSA